MVDSKSMIYEIYEDSFHKFDSKHVSQNGHKSLIRDLLFLTIRGPKPKWCGP